VSEHPRENGWPELPAIPPPLPDLPEHPTSVDLARAYATTLLVFAQLWPRTVQALEYLKRAVEEIEDRPRDKESSIHDWNELLEGAGHALSQRVKDPRDAMSSERARQIAADAVEAAKGADARLKLARIDDRRWQLLMALLGLIGAILTGLAVWEITKGHG
jgi:hypothetical protein